ncbi:MAG TPA: PilT/PilU family type 4a pilus ATPase [Thermoanaerobaculia bacterium]|jgi:twitching motility protein PilT|nr:PilT/PilU family type 4a pilus ATPase [Thermoanaerobaculia bacterium]
MSLAEDDVLFGRIALHYKLVTPDQLNEAAARQVQEGAARRLSDLLVDGGVLTAVQLQKLLAVQQDYIAKRDAAAQMAALAPPPPSAPQITEPEPVYVPAPEPEPKGPPPFLWREAERRLDAILEYAVERNASDIHVHSAAPLKMRINGRLQEIEDEVLDRDLAAAVLGEVLTPEQKSILDTLGQVDFAYTLPGKGRFRSNAYRQQRGTDAVFRAIPPEPPTLASLGLPETLARFANFHQGLVLITGPAGCGKSSTLAAMINIINQERHDHIITVEDPIEYLHRSQKCVVNQRQVGRHTNSFARALRAALREDPDVIALGELRDLETISLALTAAETGHLVLATLHTSNSIRTINRVLGVFPPSQQEQIKTMISESLRAVISQRLVPRADDKGRVAALEVLVCNKAVGNLIRENKTFQIRSVLQTGSAQGMCLLDGSLAELVKQKVITREEAARQADDPQKFAA